MSSKRREGRGRAPAKRSRVEQLRRAKRAQRQRERAAGLVHVGLTLPRAQAQKLRVAAADPGFAGMLDDPRSGPAPRAGGALEVTGDGAPRGGRGADSGAWTAPSHAADSPRAGPERPCPVHLSVYRWEGGKAVPVKSEIGEDDELAFAYENRAGGGAWSSSASMSIALVLPRLEGSRAEPRGHSSHRPSGHRS